MAPPQLLETNLYLVESLDFSGLSEMLGISTRTTAMLLYMFENLVGLSNEFETFFSTDILDPSQEVKEFAVNALSHYMTKDTVVPKYR